MTALKSRLGLLAGILAASATVLAGCESQPTGGSREVRPSAGPLPNNERSMTVVENESAFPAPRLGGIWRPDVAASENLASMAFPTGDTRTSPIMLYQVTPKQVRKGQPFEYSYHVLNLTNATLQNVLLTQDSLDNLRIDSASPSGSEGAGGTTWAIGDLGPGEHRSINITAAAGSTGIASNCISVSYNNVLCAAVEVVEPALELVKSIRTLNPEGIPFVCDPVEITYLVSNDGSGATTGIVVSDTLPDGLVTLAGGSRSFEAEVAELLPGQTREIKVQARADRRGTFRSGAEANADAGLSASAEPVGITLIKPELEIESSCRDEQFIGRNATHEFTVTNTGDAPAINSRVVVNLAGGTFIRSTGGSAAGNTVTFDLGRLEPDQSKTVGVTVTSGARTTVSATANASAYCADAVTADCSTQFKGIPAILLEMVDSPDPVEVNTNTTYTITVTNQGSANDTGIVIECQLPDELEFVSAGGATAATSRGNTVTFAPVATLAPGQRVSWTVTVKAIGEGDVRFGVEMTSDRLTSPVTETEATNLYE